MFAVVPDIGADSKTPVFALWISPIGKEKGLGVSHGGQIVETPWEYKGAGGLLEQLMINGYLSSALSRQRTTTMSVYRCLALFGRNIKVKYFGRAATLG